MVGRALQVELGAADQDSWEEVGPGPWRLPGGQEQGSTAHGCQSDSPLRKAAPAVVGRNPAGLRVQAGAPLAGRGFLTEGDRGGLARVRAARREKAVKAGVGSGGSARPSDWSVVGKAEQEAVTWGFQSAAPRAWSTRA